MRLEQFERRLERLIEGVFARAFRSGLQPVEVGRRLTREMDLHRTVAPRGTITPNRFTVWLSPSDHERFEPIEEELLTELVAVATEHAKDENYVFLGPATVTMESDKELTPGMVVIDAEMVRAAKKPEARLVMPDGQTITIGSTPIVMGRLPDCGIVLADRNVSRYHAEVRPVDGNDGATPVSYEIADLGSTNGTTVNGLPVTAARTLRPGDRITLGATTIGFEVDEVADGRDDAEDRRRRGPQPASKARGADDLRAGTSGGGRRASGASDRAPADPAPSS